MPSDSAAVAHLRHGGQGEGEDEGEVGGKGTGRGEDNGESESANEGGLMMGVGVAERWA